MTLDEAIKHAEEIAQISQKQADENKQLVAWLKDLKKYYDRNKEKPTKKYKDAEYHEIDGRMQRIPVQCDTCEGYMYFNGAVQVCDKHKGDGWNGHELVTAGHVCDDWKWCGF